MSKSTNTHPSVQNVPAYTMKGRNDQKTKQTAPGPGAYQPELYTKHKGGSFGSQQRTSGIDRKSSPGPGAYDDQKISEKSPRYTFRVKPDIKRRDFSPGPAMYKPKYGAVSQEINVSWSLTGKPKADRLSNVPGPGRYTSVRPKSEGGGRTIGRGGRINLNKNVVPGPGTYNRSRQNRSTPKAIFGSTPRAANERTKRRGLVPGPGAYEHSSPKKDIKYSMTPRRPASSDHRKSPGPGAYEAQSPGKRGQPSYSLRARLGKSPRGTSFNSPGPGAYSPISELAKGQSIPHAKRKTVVVDNPYDTGPGQYKTPSSFAGGRGYSLRSRTKSQRPDSVPGPGTYNPSEISYSPKIPIGKDPRPYQRRAVSSGPGPGSYNAKRSSRRTANAGFTSEKRDSRKRKTNDPGFVYDIPSTFASIAPY